MIGKLSTENPYLRIEGVNIVASNQLLVLEAEQPRCDTSVPSDSRAEKCQELYNQYSDDIGKYLIRDLGKAASVKEIQKQHRKNDNSGQFLETLC